MPLDPRDEEELRKFVRRELEAREQLKESVDDDRRFRAVVGEVSDERRSIIDEEIRRFYAARGDVREWENEDGETEWLTEAQISEREAQIPVDEEELEAGQRTMRIRVLMMSGLFVLGMILLFFILRERTGSLQVVSNIQGASILLDGAPTELVTDAILPRLPTGPHLIALEKPGFIIDGPPSIRVDIRPGEEAIVTMQMKLNPLGSESTLDSLKPDRKPAPTKKARSG